MWMIGRPSGKKATFSDLLLPTSTPGLSFRSSCAATYQPSRRRHANLDDLVRHRVLLVAREITSDWPADELPAAQAAVNAELGRPQHCPESYYRNLTARVDLYIPKSQRQMAAKAREDHAKIARLRHLKEVLYTDPGLLIVDRLDRNPEALLSGTDIDSVWKLVARLNEKERWWGPLMSAWNEIATKTTNPAASELLLKHMIEMVSKLDTNLAEKHGLEMQESASHSKDKDQETDP